MADWVEIGPADSIAPGGYTVVEDRGTFIAVFNVDGEFFALEDVCTHDGAELTGGKIEGCEVICPRHGSRFCIKTGQALTPPAYEPTAVFPVKVENDVVYARDDRWD
jgi:3-phenylpropionate/trans-cinnamate dioxygenase ferredoxin component